MEKIRLKLLDSGNFLMEEAYKALRTNLQFCGKDIKTVAITSCDENEGKTTIVLNLSKELSQLGKKVLVVDADMRKSVVVGRNTSAANVTGLSEFLSGMEKVENSIYATQYDNFQIMFAGKYPPNPVELLSDPYFSQFLQMARDTYDYVIIDTPPLGRVIDAAVIASICDGTILVMDEGRTRIREAQEVVGQLKKSGGKILGVVKNKTRRTGKAYARKGNRYGYGYGYGYGNKRST